ncbi:energy-coupling factor transporter ATP-binding protein EcfA2 [Oxobacter pfennigii]|uniref:Energy-coupling factor transporter ATP-binding protein EcfA2 n=1 Tax=Oxobacter pfennigii TaxID=36849 RepID=A0A0P8WJP5_9CLOT|nr:energy-coupling factor ABC transporter ATP-binding protein [Oxobacter pfennigii]KPU42385.1 energy-coupling factor transporter ATP-binding protein EcfA2 [Oxobacter pfennigii]
MISGIIKPVSGNVFVYGNDTQKIQIGKLSEKAAYIYQNPEEMFIEDSIRKDIEYFLKSRRYENYQEAVNNIVDILDLAKLQDKDGRLLSGGQQRRASIAIGVACNPSVILLDEPTGSLDISNRKNMVSILEHLRDKIKTAVITTHDMQLVAEWADRIVVMKEGKILAIGNKHDIFNNKELLKKANLKSPQIVELCQELDITPLIFTLNEFERRVFKTREGSNYGIYDKALQ